MVSGFKVQRLAVANGGEPLQLEQYSRAALGCKKLCRNSETNTAYPRVLTYQMYKQG
jgi:hypothetical protein